MLRTDLTDHRGTDDARLLTAVADGDAIALAEAYHRTVAAAHACARRLLASPVEIEALLRAVYTDLWDEPPVDTALEGWVRARCFDLGTGYLRQRNLRSPSASLAASTPGIQADPHQTANDSLEQMIAELTDQQRQALVAAHDRGIRTAEQDDPEAGWSLLHALLVLASPLTDNERHAAEMCSSGVALANWIFGLLPPYEATSVPGTAAEPTPCGRLAGVLRRARRRFEPLPPTPDLGHRVLASVLSNAAGRHGGDSRSSSLDPGLRVAYTEIGRTSEQTPRSSLDMNVPTPLPSQTSPQDVPGLRENGGPSGGGWDDEANGPTPLRSGAAGALAPPNPPRDDGPSHEQQPRIGSTPDPRDPASDDLVRMPLRRQSTRSPVGRDAAPINGGPASSPLPTDDQIAPPTSRRSHSDDDTGRPPAGLRPVDGDDDATLPPMGLRARPDDSEPGPRPGSPGGSESDAGPAPSPLRPEERRPFTGTDDVTKSPLRRPAPQARRAGDRPEERTAEPPRGLNEMAQSPLRRDDSTPPPRQRDDSTPPPRQRDDSTPPPRQRDDSTPSPLQRDDSASPPPAGTNAAAITTAAMPAVRRREPQGSSSRPAPPRPTPAPAAVAIDDEASGGSGVLRWVIVLLLIAMGAAFGVWIGLQFIG